MSAAGNFTLSNSLEVPCYPDFIPISIEQKDNLHPRLSLTFDGVSEFTFAGLYLFRNWYHYRISRFIRRSLLRSGEEGGFIISGTQHIGEYSGKKFFMTPCCAPEWDVLESLFETHDYWKNISPSVLSPVKDDLEKRGVVFSEDRNNFDYLYNRSDLAELSGKKFHKKKNHVNNFLAAYPNHEQRQMTSALIPAAKEILKRWKDDLFLRSGSEGDYKSAEEALDLFGSLALRGSIFYIDGKPAAYCMGESIARGKMFAIHFEKAIDEYRGIYQYINQAFAASLPGFFTLINREQDLGNEGMRQAKMTYRPCGFVQKHTAILRK
ncbi:MAG: phosphatidylglycerol lysyltransferase domain-containing protein [Treponema sp.]|nr:phosphatidylglycerol lysyltransferase domain-containing protein [Treponema sp.]